MKAIKTFLLLCTILAAGCAGALAVLSSLHAPKYVQIYTGEL